MRKQAAFAWLVIAVALSSCGPTKRVASRADLVGNWSFSEIAFGEKERLPAKGKLLWEYDLKSDGSYSHRFQQFDSRNKAAEQFSGTWYWQTNHLVIQTGTKSNSWTVWLEGMFLAMKPDHPTEDMGLQVYYFSKAQ
jgi:hypothetical protein